MTANGIDDLLRIDESCEDDCECCDLWSAHNGQMRREIGRLQAQRSKASALVSLAFHLRMYGENAPGGTETWAQFDREAERFLREVTR